MYYMLQSDVQKVGLPEGCKAVINLAGQNVLDPMYRWTAGFKQNVWASRVNTTKSLADAITASGSKPGVFVTVSGVGKNYQNPRRHKFNSYCHNAIY
jgi:NAD dependent epimerase/dehydratase family enzyme